MPFDRINIAVTNDNSGANGQSTMNCMSELDISSFFFDPTCDADTLSTTLGTATHIVFIGHSSDFRTVKKIKQCTNAKLITYWRGGDFWTARYSLRKRLRVYLTQCLIDDNWAVGDYFAQQIRKIGINARVVPSIIFEKKEEKRHFQKTILIYNSSISGMAGVSPEERYGIKLFIELAQRLPSFKFFTVGKGKLPEQRSNIFELGYQRDMRQIWPGIDYYLRVTDYEGLPKMIVEAAEYGVPSITKYEFFKGLMLYANMDETVAKILSYEKYEEKIQKLTESIREKHSFDAVNTAYVTALGLST